MLAASDKNSSRLFRGPAPMVEVNISHRKVDMYREHTSIKASKSVCRGSVFGMHRSHPCMSSRMSSIVLQRCLTSSKNSNSVSELGLGEPAGGDDMLCLARRSWPRQPRADPSWPRQPGAGHGSHEQITTSRSSQEQIQLTTAATSRYRLQEQHTHTLVLSNGSGSDQLL
jgi:hypothetical protein